MKKLLVILGPTATGKTDLALQLTRKFQGELVAVDSRQAYKGLDIGTGKMPTHSVILEGAQRPIESNKSKDSIASPAFGGASLQNDVIKEKGYWIIDGVRIWMYDVVDPKIQYTVADYVKDADKVIREIRRRGKLPIIVGGTGLYLKALLEGIPNLAVPVDMDLRKKLENLSLEQLQEKLKKLSTKRWKKLNESDRKNPRRLIRAIELSLSSLRDPVPLWYGAKQSHHNKGIATSLSFDKLRIAPRNDVLRIGLTAPREVLYKNTDERVLSWIDQGIIEEAKYLHAHGVSLKRMKQLGLEYGVLADYLSGEIREIKGERGLIKIMQRKIHGYVRRQLTWFKKEKDVNWFDITDKNYYDKVEKLVSRWYDS